MKCFEFSKMKTQALIFCTFIAIVTCVENQYRYKGKNKTEDNNFNKTGNEVDNVLKTEAKKYLNECGRATSEEDRYGTGYNSRRYGSRREENDDEYSNKQNDDSNRKNRNHNKYGKRNAEGDNKKSENYRYNSGRRRNRNHNCNSESDSEEDDSTEYNYYYRRRDSRGHNDDRYGRGYHNIRRSDDRNYNNYDRGYGYYNNENDDPNYSNNNFRRNSYDGRSYQGAINPLNTDNTFRMRRSNDEDVECISQCVFGYLEVLNDNRSPSESAIIKFLQDHIPNQTKRLKALRDARRCFAKLVTSDSDDGCEFSKSLSSCLELEIED